MNPEYSVCPAALASITPPELLTIPFVRKHAFELFLAFRSKAHVLSSLLRNAGREVGKSDVR
jgi:hypothetical protein